MAYAWCCLHTYVLVPNSNQHSVQAAEAHWVCCVIVRGGPLWPRPEGTACHEASSLQTLMQALSVQYILGWEVCAASMRGWNPHSLKPHHLGCNLLCCYVFCISRSICRRQAVSHSVAMGRRCAGMSVYANLAPYLHCNPFTSS